MNACSPVQGTTAATQRKQTTKTPKAVDCRSGRSPEDAEDAVQGFFASLLENDSLISIRKDKGRFRTFMLKGLKYHMADEAQKQHAWKRGGRAIHIEIDITEAEEQFAKWDLQHPEPDHDFDKAWTMELFERARVRLIKECEGTNKEIICRALFTDNPDTPSEPYSVLAQRLNTNEATLRSTALRLRKRWGELIRAEVAETVNSREAFDEELTCLKLALSS